MWRKPSTIWYSWPAIAMVAETDLKNNGAATRPTRGWLEGHPTDVDSMVKRSEGSTRTCLWHESVPNRLRSQTPIVAFKRPLFSKDWAYRCPHKNYRPIEMFGELSSAKITA